MLYGCPKDVTLQGRAMSGEAPMKRRVALALAVALALPVPLVWLTRLATGPKAPPEPGVALILGKEERWKHPSFNQPCQHSSDCQSPLACLRRAPAGHGRCMDSECATDMDCEEGTWCRTFPSQGGGVSIRACDTLHGERGEGEPCAERFNSKQRTCRHDLRCNGGWCGRPCELDESTSCPEGFFCRPGLDGPSCVPTCEGRACPEGLRCVRQTGGVSVCAQLDGEDCWSTPCSEGLGCATLDSRVNQGRTRVSMECVRACGPEQPPCTPGFHCVENACRRTCGEAASAPCREDEACFQWPDMDVRLCWPL